MSRVMPLLSLDDTPARGRIMTVTIRGGRRPDLAKHAAVADDAGAVMLAREYTKYKLATADRCARDGRGLSPMFDELCVLQNYCKG
jgi:hypothetical protein